ncbi:hypothetical protein ACOSQ3_013018 [Xanthoceras sorbifolium]
MKTCSSSLKMMAFLKSRSTLSWFGLNVNNDHTFHVMVANKERITYVGRCMALSLEIQRYQMQTDFYVLPVAACPLVLGVQWLATLGLTETDYQQLKMTFKDG